MKTLATLVGIAAFGALLFWMTLQQGGTKCEVCMSWNGEVYCASVEAATPDEAIDQARNTACGVIAQGMTNEMQCGRMPPRSTTCSE